jgi:N,N'-diacetyllegionaminate synthase
VLREIAGRPVGEGHPLFVIAEIGLNHSGSCARALEMVEAAAWAGASAIKLQTLRASELVAETCPAPAHVQATSLREFFAAFELDAEAHRVIVARARALGLAVMSTPFAEGLVEMLSDLEIDAFKIASGDLTFHTLIRTAAATGCPVVLSTGMSTLSQVSHAVEEARLGGADDVAVLHCVSAYPTPLDSQNLRAIATLRRELHVPVGLSDHSTGSHAAVAAVALGATLYERHLVLEHDHDAIDRDVSDTPEELASRIRLLEDTRIALGDGRKRPQPAELPNVQASRRGLYAARAMRAGTRIARNDVAVLRPAGALCASELPALVGSVLGRDLAPGEAFEPRDVCVERAS